MLNQRCTPLPTHRASLHAVLEQVFHHLGSQVSVIRNGGFLKHVKVGQKPQLGNSLSPPSGLGKSQHEKLSLQ